MTINELRGFLDIINSMDPDGLKMHLIKKEESEEILLADVSEELEFDLKETFRNTINAKFFNDDELDLTKISTALETENTVFYYDFDEFPEKLNTLKNFDPWNSYQEFSFTNDDIENIRAILLTIGNEDQHFTIFKHVYPVTIVRRDKMLGFFPASTRFEKLSSNILQINNSIDFIYVEGKLIINNIKTLSHAYGYHEIVKNQAKDRISLIEKLDLIDNIHELLSFVEEVKYAKRVLRIQPESPVLQLAKNHIINFILNHEKLSLKIRFNGSKDKIALDTDVSKAIVIGILNDDYLKSNLTDLDYETVKKAELNLEDDG